MQDKETGALREIVAVLQAQRGALGDALVDAALAPLLERLTALDNAQPPVAPVRRLRQVSVLFLDIVGSTQLIEHLDPEDVQTVVDGALAAFTALVRQHGGEVLRYAGDSLKAAFGADHTREDDAERAVHCGLAMLQEAQRRSAAVLQAHGQAGFHARVGIHTGPVVRGGGVEQHNSLSGLAVHIAARMEQAAPAGGLRISMETFRLVQGRFDVLEQPALTVKGLQAPMRTFLVQGVRERRLRGLRHGADGVTPALVGRGDELARLQQAADAVFAPGGGLGAATVLGDAGLGKSRLLAELQAALPAAVQAGGLWRASSHPQAQFQPYGLLRDLLFWQLGVRDSDSQAQAQHTFAAALRPVLGTAADEQTALLGQLIGLDYSTSPHIAGILRDGKQLQGRGLFAWVRYLQLQAAVQPLVLVLDDLQWADDASLDALDHLVATAPDLPLLLLCAARPELLQRRPQWAAAWPRHAQVPLQPLTETASSALADALLARFAAPVPVLQARLSAQAAGNPFYMEALLQMLVDTGVIDTRGDHWLVRDDQLQQLAVPPTLVGVLQATLDALDADQRRSLQQASVVGAQFWDGALAAIDPQAPDHLPALSQRELALPQTQSAFEGTREYGFRHHLLHQVTYGTVLKPDKRAAHGQAARWLQGRSAGRENELASQIAEHFEQAGDTAQAIAYWLRAAEDASRRQADVAAMSHADRALALDDGSDPQRRVRLHRVRAAVFMRAGNSAGHGQELEALEALADRLDDDVLRLALFNDRGWRLFMEARFEDAVELAEHRLARAEDRAPQEAGRAHNVTFICLSRLGRHDEARTHALKGLAQARATGDLNTEAAILTNMGIGDMDANRVSEALEHYAQALAAYEAAGSRMGIANVQVNLGQIENSLGRAARARDVLQQAAQTCREIGAGRLEGIARANLGVALFELGRTQDAYDNSLEGLRLARISGEIRSQAWAHHSAQQAAAGLGRFEEALAHAQTASAHFTAHNDHNAARINASAAMRHLHALGRDAEALEAADALLAEVDAQGGWPDTADSAFDSPYNLFCVLSALGDGRAAGLLETAYRVLCAQADQAAAHVPRDALMQSTVSTRGLCAAWAAAQAGGQSAPA
jgi:class 3 adenylate cyclase/tetratricopeptide (TPR) repeat protein